jgi:hypothetical protein
MNRITFCTGAGDAQNASLPSSVRTMPVLSSRIR